MEVKPLSKSKQIRKQRTIIGILAALSSVLFIAFIVSVLSRSVIQKQLNELQDSIITTNDQTGNVEEQNSSLVDTNNSLRQQVDNDTRQISELNAQVEKLKSQVARLEEANKILRRKNDMPEKDENDPLLQEVDETLRGGEGEEGEEGETADGRKRGNSSSLTPEREALEEAKAAAAAQELAEAEEAARLKAEGIDPESVDPEAEAAAEIEAKAAKVIGHKYKDKNGDTTVFTNEEWEYLLNLWAYTGKAQEMLESHTVGELRAALKAR